ncbi:hypothetical protein BGZ72_001451 [Mortierella alpina]|nr:hypothetical protein BGZ72_001451 [Mortierella alpina]
MSSLESHARDRVFALPEIVERIARSLDWRSITISLRVSRTWNAAWLPILWHTIDRGNQWRDDSFKQALHAHGDLIRVLECTRYDDISLLFDSTSRTHPSSTALCKNLISLTLPRTNLIKLPVHAQLVRQNPNLRDLSLSFLDSSSQYQDLVDAVGSLPFLRRLAFENNEKLEFSTLETILTRCNDSLQELSFKGTYFIKNSFGPGEDFASGLFAAEPEAFREQCNDVEVEPRTPFKIASLYMDEVACTQDFLLNLLSRFPALTMLSLKSSTEVYYGPDFGERLAKRCPRIKSLDISEIEDLDDQSIANLIRAFPSLHTFKGAHSQFGHKSMEALLECCPEIRELNIEGAIGIRSQSIQRLLERCGKLCKFEAWDVEVNVPKMMAESYRVRHAASESAAMASLEKPPWQGAWMCLGLEILSLHLKYDPRGLTETEQRLFPVSTARRFIFEQLSRMTWMRDLSLSGYLCSDDNEVSIYENEGDEGAEDASENISGSHESELSLEELALHDKHFGSCAGVGGEGDSDDSVWIELSFRAGLAALATLKELRTLNIYNIPHTFDIQELKWMCENWPHLRKIEGLDEDDDAEAIQWLQTHRPGIDTDYTS